MVKAVVRNEAGNCPFFRASFGAFAVFFANCIERIGVAMSDFVRQTFRFLIACSEALSVNADIIFAVDANGAGYGLRQMKMADGDAVFFGLFVKSFKRGQVVSLFLFSFDECDEVLYLLPHIFGDFVFTAE